MNSWHVALVQYEKLVCITTGKQVQGSAWNTVYIKCADESSGIEIISKSRRCALLGFRFGPKTRATIHRVENLDDAMDAKDFTPRRRRIKR